MTNTRQPGYYRVKHKGKNVLAERYQTGGGNFYWKKIGSTRIYFDEEIEILDPTPINPEPQLPDGQKEFIRGAACAVATIIHGHGYGTECKEAFKACIGSWDEFMSAEPYPYDIEILAPHFQPDQEAGKV